MLIFTYPMNISENSHISWHVWRVLECSNNFLVCNNIFSICQPMRQVASSLMYKWGKWNKRLCPPPSLNATRGVSRVKTRIQTLHIQTGLFLLPFITAQLSAVVMSESANLISAQQSELIGSLTIYSTVRLTVAKVHWEKEWAIIWGRMNEILLELH